jgi:hypothetical protein
MAAIATGDVLAQEWFDLLDQRRFTVDHESWTAQVFGVHVDGLDAWIQLEFAEDRRRSLLLHVTSSLASAPWSKRFATRCDRALLSICSPAVLALRPRP